MPFWISVAIRQESEVAVLGCQVVVLVLFNWPPAFTPLVLARIRMSPDAASEDFWSRVNFPWQSIRRKTEGGDDDDDEIALTNGSSRTTSLASTAHSGWEKALSPEAVRAWEQVASPSAANAPSHLGEA